MRAQSNHKVTTTACLLVLGFLLWNHHFVHNTQLYAPSNAARAKCRALKFLAGPASDFYSRETSDRFQFGTRPSLIRNATIWTSAHNGTEVVSGDVFLDGGIIKAVGSVPGHLLIKAPDLVVYEANGGWLTPGLVDIHTHMGVMSSPVLWGNIDLSTNSHPVAPWLRSIDGFNTHDDSFRLLLAGGVTAAQVLPGSQNAIGGQALVIKTRKTRERTPSSMVLEPPHSFNSSEVDRTLSPRWRHMKQSCGENLARWGNRMDTLWYFRSAYDKAREIKKKQDEYCEKVESEKLESLQGEKFPEDPQWEMLVDVLRGRVKISNHCYEPVDLEGIVRLTNEFRFPVASFHHASEAYLVPEVLKRTYGGTPTVANFASIQRVAREAYRDSVFSPRILADNGIPVAIKSDHGVLNARDLIFEVQQAYHFSLPWNLALQSVTSVPAAAIGMSHRIGMLKEGHDADIVLWDSNPLQLGATPRKVWVDGILQAEGVGVRDHIEKRNAPKTPDWEKEVAEEIKWEGLPPLTGEKETGKVIFINVAELWTRGHVPQSEIMTRQLGSNASVVVESGKVVCTGIVVACLSYFHDVHITIDLHGGSISPGLTGFGTGLGVEEIQTEPSTGNGNIVNPLAEDVPKITGDSLGVLKTVDALLFGTRDALSSYRTGGLTTSTTYLGKTPKTFPVPFVGGLSATFRTGASNAMERGAIVKDVTALHVAIGRLQNFASLSTQIFTLKRVLLSGQTDEQHNVWFHKAATGKIPLIVGVQSVDAMATLIELKAEVENHFGSEMRMSFVGANEAHILAKELGQARVGIILDPPRPYPLTWDSRRTMDGPPLTTTTTVVELLQCNVTVGLGIGLYASMAKNARFNMAWAALESNGRISRKQAYALVSTNFEKMLGLESLDEGMGDLVAFDGGSAFEFESKVVAVISQERGHVDLF